MTTALAISPHLDDAVFSAGGTLFRLTERGWGVTVATVFTGNVARPEGFALACQLDKGLDAGVDYMALRRAEDEKACALIGAKASHMPLLEAPHRGYQNAEDLFGPMLEADDVLPNAFHAIRSIIDDISPDILFYPRAIGGHVDHAIVRRACDMLGHPRCLLWKDWPYAGHAHPAEPFELVDRDAKTLSTHLSQTELEKKTSACLAYESQIGFQFGGTAEAVASVGRVLAETFVAPNVDDEVLRSVGERR